MSKVLEISEGTLQKLTALATGAETPEETLERLLNSSRNQNLTGSPNPGVDLEAGTWPEGAEVQVTWQVRAPFNITSYTACQHAERFLALQVGDLLAAEEASLVLGERLAWRIPVVLTNPHCGRLGRVGELRVDAETGEVLADEEMLEEIRYHAQALYHAATSPPGK